MRLHFREYGQDRNGPPLLILHGLFGSLDNWTPISRELAGTFRVLAVDQRNHGHSPHSDKMDYPLMSADVREFLDVHAPGGAHVLGHSMGGKTAMQFALDHPALAVSLIVVDMAPRAGEPQHHSVFEALSGIDLSALRSRAQAESALAPRIDDPVVRKFLLRSLIRGAGGQWHWRFNLPALVCNYTSLNAAVSADRPFVKPALFLRGEDSGYLLERDLAEIHRMFPRAEVRGVPGAGHWVHADAPGTFLRTVRKFLAPKF